MLTFERPCHTRFEKVIRHDVEAPQTNHVAIALGVLVRDVPNIKCHGLVKETVDAGPAFSGRSHSIEYITVAQMRTNEAVEVEEIDQARPSLYGSKKNVPCPVVVTPGQAIGLMQLGRKFQELREPGMVVKKVRQLSNVYVMGPYVASFNDEMKLVGISAELFDLPACVKYQDKTLDARQTMKQLRALFPGCDKTETRLGGNLTKCQGINLTEGGWGGKQKSVELSIYR